MLFAPALLALASQTPATSANTLADLVPKNTVAFVQAPSLERAAACIGRLVAAFGPAQAPKLDAAALMAMSEIPGDVATVDLSRPVGVCLVLEEGEGAQPLPVFLVPVRDADAYLKSLQQPGSPMKGVAKGAYACVGFGAAPELPAAPAPIAQGLLPGELAARLDLGRLIEQFHDSIDAGLNEIESQGAAGASAGGIDPAPMLGAYADFVRDMVDSAQTLDLGLSLDGDAVELGLALTNAEGSTLATFGSKDKTGLRALAPLLDMESGMSMLMGMNGAELMKHFQPLLESTPAAYPESFRPALQLLISRMSELYAYMGTAQAGSMDFTETGMRYRLYSRGGDPAKLLQAYRSIASTVPGCSATAVPQREVAGVKVDGVLFKVDAAALSKLAGDKDKPDAKEPGFEKLIEKLLGKDGLLIQVASKDGTGLMVIGGDDEYLRASLARVSEKSAQPAFLARALAQVGDLSPCVIVHYDLGRMMAGMKDLLAEIMPTGVVTFPSIALATTFWGGVDGRVWRGALELNLSELAALAHMNDRKPVSQEPKVVIPMILQALDEYAINNSGKYPDSLEPLVTPDANGASYLEGYEGRIPKDPWNHEYLYEPPSAKHPKPRVLSYGSDGAPGGTGDAADIDSDSL